MCLTTWFLCLLKPPIEKTLEIIRDRLKNDRDLRNRTNLNVDDLMELVKFVLTTTYFTSNGIIYQQKSGAAMGSPLSPIAVNLFMKWLEEQVIRTNRANYQSPQPNRPHGMHQVHVRGGKRRCHRIPRH